MNRTAARLPPLSGARRLSPKPAAPSRASPSPPGDRTARLVLQACLLVLSFAVALYASSQWIHPAWSLVAMANFGWLSVLLFKIEPRATVLLLPQLINTASSMVSLIMIEFGAEMFELGLVGRPGPWSNALNLYTLLFCCGVLLAFRPIVALLDRKRGFALTPILDRYANLLAWGVLVAAGLIATVLVLRGLISGFPLLAGIDRFQFRRFAADKVTLYALNFKFIIGYALGFVAFSIPTTRTLRRCAVGAFAVLMLIFFLFGDKFFTQLSALAAFTAPYLYCHHRKVARQLGRYAVAAVLALAAVMAVTTYIYSNGFTMTSAETSKRLSGRMVGQGELWFLQASIGAPPLTWNGPVLERYARTLTIKAIDLYALQNSVGPHYFSNLYAPDYLRASLHRNAGSVTYTSVTEAMGLVLFGWIGLGAMMIVLGAALGLVCAYIAFAIESRSVLSGTFAAYIYVQLRSSIIQATPWVIASVYSGRWLMVVLAIEIALVFIGRSAMPHARRTTALPARRRPGPATQRALRRRTVPPAVR